MFDSTIRAKVTQLAAELGVEPAALLAVAEVESQGTAIWTVNGQNRPPIRFEGHYFHKRLKGAALQRAVSAGLANPKAGAVANPRTYSARYALLERAKGINEAAALESTSWGLGQVMGSWWSRLGYGSVQQLVRTAESGVDGQIELMARYIREFGLVQALKNKDWTNFAYGYNGPQHAKGNYAGKMKAAYARYKNDPTKPAANELIKLWQRDLKTLGYYKGNIDGIVGKKSRAATRAFQRDQGLVEDGIVGPMVKEAITQELRERKLKQAESAQDTGAVILGTDGTGQVILEQSKDLQAIAPYSEMIQYVIIFLAVVGVALIAYGLYSKRKSKRE